MVVRSQVLEPDRADSVLRAHVDRHPRVWSGLKPVLENTLGSPIGEDGAGLPLVQLELI